MGIESQGMKGEISALDRRTSTPDRDSAIESSEVYPNSELLKQIKDLPDEALRILGVRMNSCSREIQYNDFGFFEEDGGDSKEIATLLSSLAEASDDRERRRLADLVIERVQEVTIPA